MHMCNHMDALRYPMFFWGGMAARAMVGWIGNSLDPHGCVARSVAATMRRNGRAQLMSSGILKLKLTANAAIKAAVPLTPSR